MDKRNFNPNNTTKETITERFMHAVTHIISYRRHGVKNESQFAKIIGAVPQNMSKYRNGAQGVTVEHIARMCEYFDINDSYILRGKGNLEEMLPITMRIDKLESELIELQKQVDLVLSSRKKQ